MCVLYLPADSLMASLEKIKRNSQSLKKFVLEILKLLFKILFVIQIKMVFVDLDSG